MPPRKPKLPDPLPSGLNLTDTEQNTWRVGKMIGQGGFGMIYLASGDVSVPVPDNTAFVAKVEYHENGPLFSELKFYQRVAKQEMIIKWKECRRMSFLGIPTYWGSGLFEHNGTRYRFMVIDRLGTDLQKVIEENDGQLKKPTVLQLGIHMLDVLEYIHDHEYVHADIKGANLLLGHSDPSKVYLADYGLSYRYCPNGQHKAYKVNAKKGHNGTIEYTSIDAHKGAAPSRRGDLEVLGYCLLHWQCGTLPWLASLRNPAEVQEAKTKLICNLPGSVLDMDTSCSGTDELARFLGFVKNLGYDEKPDYQALRKVLSEARQQGPPDLSRVRALEPSRPTTQRTANRPKPPDKKTDRSKLAVRAEDEDEEFCASTTNKVQSQIKCETPKQRPHRAAKLRAMQNPKLYTCDEDSSDEDEQTPRQAQTKTRAGPRPVVNQIRTAPVKQDNTDFADVEATMTRRKQNNHQYEDLTLHNNGVEPSSEDDYQKNYSRDHKRREQSEYSGHHWASAVSGRDDKWICRMWRVTGTSGNQPKLSCRSTKHGNILTFFLLFSLAVAFAWAVMKQFPHSF